MNIDEVLVGSVRIVEGILSRARNVLYSLLGVNIQGYAWIRSIEIPRNFRDIELGSGCMLDRGVVLLSTGTYTGKPRIRIGEGTYINRYSIIDSTEEIIIGKNCAIGPNVYITDHDHGTEMNVAPLAQPMISKPTRISDKVWLGANVVVLKGIEIGASSVVGAGSVVTKSLPANSIAVGNPARVIRMKH